MKNLTLENITKVCNGIYHGPQEKLQEEVTAITQRTAVRWKKEVFLYR